MESHKATKKTVKSHLGKKNDYYSNSCNHRERLLQVKIKAQSHFALLT